MFNGDMQFESAHPTNKKITMTKKEIKEKVWAKLPIYFKLGITHTRSKTRFLNNIYDDIIKEEKEKLLSIDEIIKAHSNRSLYFMFSNENSKEGFAFWLSVDKWIKYYNEKINS